MPFGIKARLDEDQLQLIAKALADPRRYDILKHIAAGGCRATPCSAMRESFDISPATLSHHMKELETAGLIRVGRDGKFASYTVEQPILRAYLAQLKTDLA